VLENKPFVLGVKFLLQKFCEYEMTLLLIFYSGLVS
jgi:hypothetical protein